MLIARPVIGSLIVEVADIYTGDIEAKDQKITAPREACGGNSARTGAHRQPDKW